VTGGYTVQETIYNIDGYETASATYTVGDSGEKKDAKGGAASVEITGDETITVAFEDSYTKPETPVQTPDEPVIPEEPETPETPEKDTISGSTTTDITTTTVVTTTTTEATPTTETSTTDTSSSQVKTGDSTPVRNIAILMVVSVLALMGLGIYGKLAKKDEED
jgi:cobalamin biosynthesis Mg chelatase CobN